MSYFTLGDRIDEAFELCDLCAALAQDNSGPIAPTRTSPTGQEGEEAPNRHATAPTVGWEQGKPTEKGVTP